MLTYEELRHNADINTYITAECNNALSPKGYIC